MRDERSRLSGGFFRNRGLHDVLFTEVVQHPHSHLFGRTDGEFCDGYIIESGADTLFRVQAERVADFGNIWLLSFFLFHKNHLRVRMLPESPF